MLIGQILYNHKTKRLNVFTQSQGYTESFDITNQELAFIYVGASVNFHLNLMNQAADINILVL